MSYKPRVLSTVDGGTGLSASGTDGNILTSVAGVWASVAPATSGTVTSVSGTTNRITSTGGNTPVIDISASYVGQSSITTLGTIATGVWQGTVIDPTYGGTGINNTPTSGKVLIGNGTDFVTSTPGYPNTSATTGKFLLSDGTNFIASTPTIANAAGTAGKVLVSDGTNFVTSTPTFPNASATSGKFIRSDGTNWIASTPTLPTTAGSSGKVLISDGTNWVSSTPTFPTSVGSTGTILRSDGTNWVATTTTFPNTNAISTLVYASAANVLSALATANNGVLVTSSTGVPSILVGPGSTGKILQSNSAAAPSYSTATYPSTAGSSGKILISDGTNVISSTPTYPNAAGTSGNFVKSDGTNFTSSALPSVATVATIANTASIANVTGDGTLYGPILFNTALFDVGSNYNTGTGIYTTPTAGKYLVTGVIALNGITALHTQGQIRMTIAGSTYTQFDFVPTQWEGICCVPFSIIINITAGNTIGFLAYVAGSTKVVGIQGQSTGYFTYVSFQFLG